MVKSEYIVRKQVFFFILLVCCSCLLLFFIFSVFRIPFYNYCFPMTFFLFIVCLYLFRDYQSILFVDIYIFFYFIYLFYHFYQGKQLSEYLRYQQTFFFEKACLLFYIFYYCQFCTYYIVPKKGSCGKHYIVHDRYKLSSVENIFLVFLMMVLLILSFRIGTNMIRVGFNYKIYINNLKESSVIPLFFVIFFAIYSFSENANKLLCYCFMFVYLYFCFSRGFRVTAIPACLVMYFAFYEGRISNKLFLGVLLLGLIILLISGVLKDVGSVNFKYLFNGSNKKMIISHHADVLYTVSSTFGLVEENYINFFQRCGIALSFFFQSVIPPSLFPETLRYPQVVSYFTENGGGGLFLAGSWLMGGMLGVFFVSFLVNILVLRAYDTKSQYFNLAMVIVLVFTCNWVSYDFHVILRFPVYAVVLFWLLTHFKWRYLKIEKKCFDNFAD